jgi:uncharacterized protein
VIVDANLLLYAVDERSGFHPGARDWLTAQLNGPTRLGLPWQSLYAFVRISTNPRAYESPLKPEVAWRRIEDWLQAEATWIPLPTDGHAEVLGTLIRRYELRGDLVADAVLAALAIEHGVGIASADTDFARFVEVDWHNPLR